MGKARLYVRRLSFIVLIPFSLSLLAQNYSKQLQQAILLYQEGKTTDAMDRFMDILVSGTPEEKIVASEYISRITQGISPNLPTKPSETKVLTPQGKDIAREDLKDKSNKLGSSTSEMSEDELIAKKVSDKIKEIKNDILLLLYRKSFIKLYMDQENERPNYILIKEDRIFNDDMTFKATVLEDLKRLSGLMVVLRNATITILPNGAITGNMKIANVRRATILHSYLLSYGLSPTKVKIDLIGSSWQSIISKKIDDFDGIIFAFDYKQEPQLVVDSDTPQAYIAIYPDKIDTSKDQAAVVDFSALMGRNPLASWKMMLNKNSKTSTYTLQKVENTAPTCSQIIFNGRERFIGRLYEPGEYEFVLEVSDVKGNTATARKKIYIVGSAQEVPSKITSKDISRSPIKKTSSSQQADSAKKAKDIVYKIYFEKDSFNITPPSQQALADFVNDIKVYPHSKIILTGYSYSKEPKPKTAAYKRASVVKNLLVKNYKIEPTRITILTKVVNSKKTIVEITVK